MCGIAGIVGPDASPEILARMIGAEQHRGPDDQGMELLPSGIAGTRVGLGHCRLAILDLSPAGHQPMQDPASGLWTVFNGEIFNHLDLRRELGGEYRSTCDTETLLCAIDRWGTGAIDRFRGMFAFAVWDGRRGELLLCRDRMGIKPLYYAELGGNLVFASELRAVLASGLCPRKLDSEAVHTYLAFGAVQEPRTIVRGVRLLEAGHWMRVSVQTGRRESRRYWSPPFRSEPQPTSTAKLIENIGDHVTDAVRCRLLSDVPLGAFLSGGIDSSAVVACMARAKHRKIRTLTLHFEEQGYGEGAYAELVARRYQTEHTTENVRAQDLLARFNPGLDAADQPSIDGINTYYVCEVAKRSGLTVALCGHGGDELFGGYDNFRLLPRVLRFRMMPRMARHALAGATRRWAPARVATRKAASLLDTEPDIYNSYAIARSIFLDDARSRLLDDSVPAVRAADVIRAAVPPGELAADPVNQVSQLELSVYMRNTLLRDTDACSMAHALEVRVPLLDHRLIECVAPLHGRLKVAGRPPKRLLVRALGDALPPEVHLRRKQGFVIPYQLWMRNELRPCIDAVLGDARQLQSIGLRPERVKRVWDRFLGADRSVNMQHPLALYALARWCARNSVTA
jgi:asparagine synthase (glutamine-hydrolysing)